MMNTPNTPEVKTVNIPVDEYFDLRQKAEINAFLMTQLGELNGRLYDLDRRVYELEVKLKEGKKHDY